MISSIKAKGRPKGSEKDDGKALAAIADHVLVNPKLKVKTAIRHCKLDLGEANVRRLQAKWKLRKDVLLEEAAARAEQIARQKLAPSQNAGRGFNAAHLAAMGALSESSAMRFARGLDFSPAAKIIAECQNSPAMRIMREMQDSPVMRLAREMQDSPVMRMAREMALKNQSMIDRLTKFGGM